MYLITTVDQEYIAIGYTIKVVWYNGVDLPNTEYYCDIIMANQWAKQLSEKGTNVSFLRYNGTEWVDQAVYHG